MTRTVTSRWRRSALSRGAAGDGAARRPRPRRGRRRRADADQRRRRTRPSARARGDDDDGRIHVPSAPSRSAAPPDRSARDHPRGEGPHRHRLGRPPAAADRPAGALVLPALPGAARRLPLAAHPAALPRAHARPPPRGRRDRRTRTRESLTGARLLPAPLAADGRRRPLPARLARARSREPRARRSGRSRTARRRARTTTGSRRSSSRASARTAATSTRPLLLTTSHWNEKGAFTIAGPLLPRSRRAATSTGALAPFFFRGDNGDLDGARRPTRSSRPSSITIASARSTRAPSP